MLGSEPQASLDSVGHGSSLSNMLGSKVVGGGGFMIRTSLSLVDEYGTKTTVREPGG